MKCLQRVCPLWQVSEGYLFVIIVRKNRIKTNLTEYRKKRVYPYFPHKERLAKGQGKLGFTNEPIPKRPQTDLEQKKPAGLYKLPEEPPCIFHPQYWVTFENKLFSCVVPRYLELSVLTKHFTKKIDVCVLSSAKIYVLVLTVT